MLTETVTRYVITHVPEKGPMAGVRTLTFGAQGRYTYATMTEAEMALVEWDTQNGLGRVLTTVERATLAVRPCECWAGHFDPAGVYF